MTPITIYVAFRDYGTEGKSEPIFATTNFTVAQAWQLGGQQAMGVCRAKEMVVDYMPTSEWTQKHD